MDGFEIGVTGEGDDRRLFERAVRGLKIRNFE